MKKKTSYRYSIYDHKPLDIDNMVNWLIAYVDKLVYKKVDNGYHVHCNRCGYDDVIPFKKLKMMRTAGMCCHCGKRVRFGTKTKDHFCRYAYADEGDAQEGYRIEFDYDFGNYSNVKYDHVLHCEKGVEWVRCIYKCMTSISYNPDKHEWRKTRGTYASSYDFYYYIGKDELKYDSLKNKYIEFTNQHFIEFKSNQKKFISEGVYNDRQLTYIYFFDLNYPEEVEKYNKYIKNNYIYGNDFREKLNVHYLNYLNNENIHLSDYMDYANACYKLGIKPEKPKNDKFWRYHDNAINQVKAKENEIYEKLVEYRVGELKRYEYSKENYQIKLFNNVHEIIETGEKLHNCIGTYVKRYANKKTNIFYATENNQLAIAIEVRGESLIQARTNYNRGLNEEQKKFIKSWCKNKGIECNSIV